MREVRVPGCKASSIAPVRRCGGRSETEDANQFCAPGKPAVFALNAQSLRSGVSPDAEHVLYRKALQANRTGKPGQIRVATGGLAPTASGANSVASALGSLVRRDPGKTVRTYHGGLSTNPQNRNFLLWWN